MKKGRIDVFFPKDIEGKIINEAAITGLSKTDVVKLAVSEFFKK